LGKGTQKKKSKEGVFVVKLQGVGSNQKKKKKSQKDEMKNEKKNKTK
jgi:hypothetical protein